jgi:hypothetical protein
MLKKLTAFAASRKRITLTIVLATSDKAEPTFHAILAPKPRVEGEIAADEMPLKFSGTAEEIEEQINAGDFDQYLAATGAAPSNLPEILAKIEAEKVAAAKKPAPKAPAKKTAAKKPAPKPAAKKPATTTPRPAATPKPTTPQAPAASAPATAMTLDSILS